jgi:dipeptidyl aminopeptidase/acylaminoacyl peptidase
VASLGPAMDRGDPENLRIGTRVLVEQGLSDSTVFPSLTGQLIDELRHRGTKLRYHTYPGVSHPGVVTAAATDATRWIRGRLPR